jgi:hypothetical protein
MCTRKLRQPEYGQGRNSPVHILCLLLLKNTNSAKRHNIACLITQVQHNTERALITDMCWQVLVAVIDLILRYVAALLPAGAGEEPSGIGSIVHRLNSHAFPKCEFGFPERLGLQFGDCLLYLYKIARRAPPVDGDSRLILPPCECSREPVDFSFPSWPTLNRTHCTESSALGDLCAILESRACLKE